MACVKFISYLVLFSASYIRADECITYDFENDIDNLFVNDKGMCAERDYLSWNVRSYSNIELNSPHVESMTYISAPLTLGCGSTFDFTMTGSGTISTAPSGIIEAKVYLDFNSTSGYIIMDAMIVMSNGKDLSVAEASVASHDNNVVTGWQTLRIDRIGLFGTHQGYVSFYGRGGANSLILVDSFRYIPPDVDEESCVVYKSGLETTEVTVIESTTLTTLITTAKITHTTVTETHSTTTEILSTTTEASDDIEKCVTYNFENDYDLLFSSDNDLCYAFLPWQLKNYTSIHVESPNPESMVMITPHEEISCISSVVFNMEAGGIIEAKVFMEPNQDTDHIIVQVYKVTDNEFDTVAGFKLYHQGDEAFLFGWNEIRFSLLGFTSFDGYVALIGSADRNSTVLVDSLRYIPPTTPAEDESCNLY